MSEARAGGSLRVVMFVHNDVSRDSRVLREAKSLADAGHQVTVIGKPRSTDERSVSRIDADGFTILLVPPPHVWRTWLQRYRKPWRMRGLIGRRFTYWLGRGPVGWVRAVAYVGVAFAVTAWTDRSRSTWSRASTSATARAWRASTGSATFRRRGCAARRD